MTVCIINAIIHTITLSEDISDYNNTVTWIIRLVVNMIFQVLMSFQVVFTCMTYMIEDLLKIKLPNKG